MKFIISWALFLVLFPVLLLAGDPPTKTNTYVSVEASVKQKSLKAGTTGDLLISLTPQQGIHINLQPPIDLRLDSTASSGISASGKPFISALAATGYLNPAKPVVQRFTVPKSARPGNLTLKGTLTYFYCSDAEGWCSRFKQPIDLKVSIVP